MAKRDINLFRAAGGERAKASKRSPVSIMLVVGLIIVVAALGVAAYFNMKVNTAKTDYQKKETILTNYQRVIGSSSVQEASTEYNTVKGDIESASIINRYVDTMSALYPEATEGEIAAIKNTILDNPLGEAFNLNDPDEETGTFTPRDYEGLRASFYAENAEDFENKELFYYALQVLAEKQETVDQDDEVDPNVWYAYYRCYFVAVFTGGDSIGLPRLISALASPAGTMNGQAPFTTIQMENDVYDDETYVPAKFHSIIYNDETYNIILMPMKSVIERAYDILDGHAKALSEQLEAMGESGDNVRYGVESIEFNNQELKFRLILPSAETEEGSLAGYMQEFTDSYFFKVGADVVRPGGDASGVNVAYQITLLYKNRPVIEQPEED